MKEFIMIGQFEAGETFNVIADTAKLIGTARYLDVETQEQLIYEMDMMIKGGCISHDASYRFDYQKGNPPLVNHAKEAEHVLDAGKAIQDLHNIEEEIGRASCREKR